MSNSKEQFQKQMSAFTNGGWTLDRPQKTGKYLVRARDCDSGENVINLYELEGLVHATQTWGGYWWSEPLPNFPPTPDFI